MPGRWGRRTSVVPAEEAVDLVGILTEAVDAVRPGAAGAIDHVVDVLLRVDGLRDGGVARQALLVLASRPRVLVRLDEHVRRSPWAPVPNAAAVDLAARKVGTGAAGPVTLVIASMHRDGRIRERAVAEMLAAADPMWLPFLVLRTADWVGPVRERARYGLAVLVGGQPETYLPAVLPTAITVRAWHRGGFAHAQAMAALLLATPRLREQLLAASGVEQRRFLLESGLSHGWWSAESVLGLAKAGDVRVRAKAAEVVCRQAVWNNRVDALRRLARHRGTEVREQALIGLARLGRHADVTPYLDDRAPLTRAIARASARQTGADATGYYRQAVSVPDPALGAIAGLAEVGNAADAEILARLLGHPHPPIRAHALRALHHLEALPADQVVAMLRDPSPAVVREATTALRHRTKDVPPDLAWQLLSEPDRAELRRAGYRLLKVRGIVAQLRAALLLVADPDVGLARRAVADATRIAREAAGPSRYRLTLPPIDATPEQTAELTRLTTRAAGTLGEQTTAMLHDWLTRTSG